jgi:crossover junction endodeoxyribonuclease RuvC
MTILGIDPGTATTGYGIIKQTKNQPELVDFGVIATDKKLSDAERLKILADDVSEIIAKYKPEAVGIEKLFFTTNQKTVMSVSQARGVILYICEKHKIPIYEFTPLQVKNFICGYGKAEKKQVQYIIQKTFKLKSPPKPDDAADAVAIAMSAGHFFSKHLDIKKIR